MGTIGLYVVTMMLLAGEANAAMPVVKDMSFKDADGHRVLRESVLVDASTADVWRAFTTDSGFTHWAAPVAHITPGNGGLIEFPFSPTGKIGDPTNVRNRILVYLPDELIITQNEFVPVGGPMDPRTFGSVRTIIALSDEGGKTRVTQTVIGFGDGPAYDSLYDHLRGGNAQYLAKLVMSFAPTVK